MKKWFFNFVVGMSLLLFVATAGLWVRSYWKFDHVYYRQSANGDRIIYDVFSCYGSVGASYGHEVGSEDLITNSTFIITCGEANGEASVNMMEGLGGWYRFGFGYANFIIPKLRVVAVMAPHWLLMLLFLILPLNRFVRFRRRRNRLRKGLCLRCGYDLRATPDRCPECGTPIAAATSGRENAA